MAATERAGVLRSGELARAAGVNPQTLRYYHRRGLLEEPARSPGGHRLYPAEALTTIRVVKSAQRLGFTLAEIAELVHLAAQRHGTRRQGGQRRGAPPRGGRARPAARAKIAELDRRIADLQAIRAELAAAVAAADSGEAITCTCEADCPLPLADLA
jgi:MerR family transcriptional regulator, mercuric resistance operon regulatory protein